MLHCILASTSTVYGKPFLNYLLPEIDKLFKNNSEIIFIPFAQPGGISCSDYTAKVSDALAPIDIKVYTNLNRLLTLFQKPMEFLLVAATLLFCSKQYMTLVYLSLYKML
jgi:peptidase E